MPRKNNRALLLVLATLPFSVSTSNACSPADLTPQEYIDGADVIVIGNAVASHWKAYERRNLFDWIWDEVSFFLPERLSYAPGKTVFKIRKTLKGDTHEYVTVYHDVSPASCGDTFDHYGRKLLFIYANRGRYTVNAFSNNGILSNAERIELVDLLGISQEDYVDGFSDIFFGNDSDAPGPRRNND